MSNFVKVGRIDINLEALKGVSRIDINKMYPRQSESWRNALWSHLEMLKPSKEKEPTKKKTKSKKEGE